MSITAANLTDGIRVDRATQKGSIYDVISVVTQTDNTHVTQTFARITRNNPELNPKCVKLRIKVVHQLQCKISPLPAKQ